MSATELETAETFDAAAVSSAYLSPVMARYFERSWSHGVGHRLYDTDGRAYLDFATGIAVSILGHAHPRVTAAIQEQAAQLVHVGNGLGYMEPVARLAEMLVGTLPAPLDSVFFGNSGTEVVEGALKLARRATGRPTLIGFEGSFHGRTFGSLSLTTSNPNYQRGHGPLLPGVYLAPYPTTDVDAALGALRELLIEVDPDSVAAVLIEPELGEGGYIPAPLPFLRALRELCDRHGILLISDEIQTGYGRTGRMWAFEHAGIVPDVVIAAKGIANGLPLGAIVARRELHEKWGVGAHGSTFGGNLVACAAGLAVLATIADEHLIENAAARGDQLAYGLREIKSADERITDVRGRGLMIGAEVSSGDLANRLISACADAGLLVLTCGVNHDVIRWLAPLNVTADEIDEGLGIFAGVLRAA